MERNRKEMLPFITGSWKLLVHWKLSGRAGLCILSSRDGEGEDELAEMGEPEQREKKQTLLLPRKKRETVSCFRQRKKGETKGKGLVEKTAPKLSKCKEGRWSYSSYAKRNTQ